MRESHSSSLDPVHRGPLKTRLTINNATRRLTQVESPKPRLAWRLSSHPHAFHAPRCDGTPLLVPHGNKKHAIAHIIVPASAPPRPRAPGPAQPQSPSQTSELTPTHASSINLISTMPRPRHPPSLVVIQARATMRRRARTRVAPRDETPCCTQGPTSP